ncbi:MAG: cytochrome d ubiquinol oxidase subunit II [Pseudomonadota bacterium]
MTILLPMIWAGIIAFCFMMYIILDGFTLGTGIIFPFMNRHERDIAMSVILPTWDGNQTWLVLAMASLYGAFPLAFAMALPKFYLPLIILVILLLFRGVVFEFRLKSSQGIKIWDMIFCIASSLIAFLQGMLIGSLLLGFKSHHDFFNGFAMFTGLTFVCAYMMLGVTRLILKTVNPIQQKMYRLAARITAVFLVCFLILCLWIPFVHPELKQTWLMPTNWKHLFYLPLAAVMLTIALCFSLYRRHELAPYWFAVALVLCMYCGFGAGIFPYAIPYQLTIWQAASPNSTLLFISVGAVIMLPVLLIYTGYSYRIFSGKVKDVLHY